MKNNHRPKLALCLLLCGLLLAACTPGSESSIVSQSSAADSTTQTTAADTSEAPLASSTQQDWADDATRIVCQDDTATITGTGAAYTDGTISITTGGTYVLSGTLTDGLVFIDVPETDTVELTLNGVSLTNSQGPAIWSLCAKETILHLADGTQNSLSDGTSYEDPNGDNAPNGAVFAQDDLRITGTGALVVTGNYKNGISSKDVLTVTDGQLTVTAPNDGLRGRDGITVSGGSLQVAAQDDGLCANNDTDADKGWITITGGSFHIEAGNDAIQAETALTIDGGNFQIKTGDGAQAVPVQTEAYFGRDDQAAATAGTTESLKGLKAGTTLTINGGDFVIDTEDDALHCGTDLLISGGSFQIKTGDDGLHADNALTINGGDITVSCSYEAVEGTTITITEGNLNLTASDDGLNAAGSETAGFFGMDGVTGDSRYLIHITGGSLQVDAGGDGLDANGSLVVDGGSIYISGPTNSGNSAIDADGGAQLNGGTIAAVGAAGMHQSFSTANQPCLTVYYTEIQSAGTEVSLRSQDGTVLVSFAPGKDYQAATLSSPALVIGETYDLYAGDTLFTAVTLNQNSTTISSDGSEAAENTGMSGFGGSRGGGLQNFDAPEPPNGQQDGRP